MNTRRVNVTASSQNNVVKMWGQVRIVAFEGPGKRTSTRFECLYCADSYFETDLVAEYVDEMAAFCSCGARMIDSEAMAYRVARHLAHNRRAGLG